MAEGLTRYYLGEFVEPFSAGTFANSVNPNAVKVMAEIGIDISRHRSKDVAEFSGQSFDLVVTVCDEGDEQCPLWLGTGEKVHIPFYDPVQAHGSIDEILNAFRRVRDQMKETLLTYLKKRYTTTENK